MAKEITNASPRWDVVVGLTGGIGSGKSTVLQMFKKKGAFVLDADEIVNGLLAHNKKVLASIRKKFGADVFDGVGVLIRRKLGERVFVSPSDRFFLEKLLHPLVRSTMKDALRGKSGRVAICDIPLLFETKAERRCDEEQSLPLE